MQLNDGTMNFRLQVDDRSGSVSVLVDKLTGCASGLPYQPHTQCIYVNKLPYIHRTIVAFGIFAEQCTDIDTSFCDGENLKLSLTPRRWLR